MNDTFTIGEIAQFLNIPPATLRFWEEKGLFSVAKSSNQYRRYTLGNLVQIANMSFYRHLGIPIREARSFEGFTVSQHREALLELQRRQEERVREDQEMLRLIQAQTHRMEELTRLMEREYELEDIPFEAVEPFDYREKDKLIRYTRDPSLYVRYYDTGDMDSEARGIIVPLGEPGPLLWKKQPGRRYVTFLIRERVERDYQSDVREKLAPVRKAGGVLLARYLTTATEGEERIDFLKAYLEITDGEP